MGGTRGGGGKERGAKGGGQCKNGGIERLGGGHTGGA